MEPINGSSAAAAAQTSTQTSSTQGKDAQNQFLQLLVAQLKGQNPLDPMDGTQFVAQLAQFSSLEELTKIHANTDSIQQFMSQSATANSSGTNSSTTNTQN